MKVAVVGATGMVGQVMLQVLEEKDFPVSEFYPVASARSVGKTIQFKGKDYSVISMEDAIDFTPDIALFSAGGQTSLEYAPRFAAKGTVVIDNSSAWRMNEDKKLIVPEINGNLLTSDDKIIANPNCSTIQLVMAMAPLHKKFQIQRMIISTYQSVTGTGVKAKQQLIDERAGKTTKPAYPYEIDMNCLPHCDVFLENDYTKEEMKLVHETKKILNDSSIAVTATAVRVPVVGGHSESINVSFKNDFDLQEVKSVLNETEGVVVLDQPSTNTYPMPVTASGKDEVFVGRIRRDDSFPNSLNLWVVADNLRKGAATNAVQIAEIIAGLHT